MNKGAYFYLVRNRHSTTYCVLLWNFVQISIGWYIDNTVIIYGFLYHKIFKTVDVWLHTPTRSLAFPIETPLKSTGVSQSTPHFSKYTRFSALKHLLPKKQMHKSQWAPAVHYNNFWSQKDKAHGDIQPCFTRFWSICMHELNGHLWTFCCSSLISQARRK